MMTIGDYLVAEIEHNRTLRADVRGSTVWIWSDTKKTTHTVAIASGKPLSAIASELVAEHMAGGSDET